MSDQSKNKISVIKASHYDETVKKLMADPIVQEMAAEIPENFDTESWGFMQVANKEYNKRGGTIGAHIGGVSEAITELKEKNE